MKKKTIITITIVSIMALCSIFAFVDYNRLMNGKNPIFMKKGISVESFDVCIKEELEEGDWGYSGDNEKCNANSSKYQKYQGLGYQIAVCSNIDITTKVGSIACEKEVNFAPFKIF